MIYFIRHLNWVIFRLVYNGLSWFGYRCFLVMRAILCCYFMKGIKYTPLCLLWGFSNYFNYSSTVYFGDTNSHGYFFSRVWSRPWILISGNSYGFHMNFKVFEMFIIKMFISKFDYHLKKIGKHQFSSNSQYLFLMLNILSIDAATKFNI